MIFIDDIRHWLFPKKLKPAGKIKTPEQIDAELQKLMTPKILRKLKQDANDRADMMLFKMLDARNLTLVGLTLNWVMGRFEKTPVDFVTEMISDRKSRTSKDSTQALFEQWLKLHAIDKKYLMALIGEVAPYEILKGKAQTSKQHTHTKHGGMIDCEGCHNTMDEEKKPEGDAGADAPATPETPETPPADGGTPQGDAPAE